MSDELQLDLFADPPEEKPVQNIRPEKFREIDKKYEDLPIW